jgi:transcriptional regulator with AAA-type ATPase domain
MNGQKYSILVISSSKDVQNFIKDIVAALQAAKGEFQDLSVQIMKDDLNNKRAGAERGPLASAVLVICEVGQLSNLIPKLQKSQLKIPLIAVIGKCSPQDINDVYRWGYLYTRGVLIQTRLNDPEDRGYVAQLIKDEVRRGLALRGQRVVKTIGWKIQSTPEDYTTEKKIVSLFLDRTMRDFMEKLMFIVERTKTKLPLEPFKPEQEQQLHEFFVELGEALKAQNKNLRNLKARAEKLQLFEPRDSTKGVLRPAFILLEGETGTGKTIIAEWISRQLQEGGGEPLLHIPTVNISQNLLESELFGSLEGAFTGAVSRPGKLLLGRGRVIFLDEIGDIPLEAQAKLLVYLDKMTFRPDGWPFLEPIYSPAYVIAATNKDLKAGIRQGQFREDLYHRFRHKLTVPPLRARKSDLRILIDFVLQDPSVNPVKGSGQGRLVNKISLQALDRLEAHEFPGNFRELEDVLSQAVFHAAREGREEILKEDISLA